MVYRYHLLHYPVASPSYVGYKDTPGYAVGVHVSGNYAYVADAYNGLRIIDVRTPSSPVKVGFYNVSGFTAKGVTVSGPYAFVAAYTGGIRVIDVSNPTSPVLADSYKTPETSQALDVMDGYVYVATGYCGLSIVDGSAYDIYIRVTSPNGEEIREEGSEQVITWNSAGISGDVTIEYSADSGDTWELITSTAQNTGSFNWTVPMGPSQMMAVTSGMFPM